MAFCKLKVDKKDGFKVSFGPVLQHSLNPSVTLLNWVKVCNAVCTPTPIHRLCTQTFSPPQKTNALLGIEPAAPPPSQSPSRDVNPLHQSTTRTHVSNIRRRIYRDICSVASRAKGYQALGVVLRGESLGTRLQAPYVVFRAGSRPALSKIQQV